MGDARSALLEDICKRLSFALAKRVEVDDAEQILRIPREIVYQHVLEAYNLGRGAAEIAAEEVRVHAPHDEEPVSVQKALEALRDEIREVKERVREGGL